ncbi:hypothetical protein B9Q11_02575 [Candidatus Marsarchaeota G2 archaeon ECH_B_SAG-F08]|uniref:Zinc-ribbon domain-containing protein n=5 Tax=Candidatus Marsarchaeota TaxID=1978152 RepID=A0A2R6AEB2_9ARCH|nr:MAG: hypothetical protein B9Q01_03465 [Candidatus Marsarchaeota G1 archaeon OSP_D]PSN84726.1 MAG: hypothetical protein B9Q02_09045 [Candidatus Marsarchaeota G1 archaeon BE_D]PSN87536.1 MAG: hypothetical protein B9P99_06440 [Candidatus Marsarchaeota G1 archaeon OSP_B]PSN98224.1 MAG: hypothetical protein B9Q11_02575 [Candidatus Marsarchaeota G2 archaeon ECH_B_SAG-F08]
MEKLASSLESYLSSKGYNTQKYKSSDGSLVVQARKGGFLRAIVNAQRAFTIHISGNPDDVSVKVGVANWGQDLAVEAIEALLVDDLALVSGVEMLWNLKIEKEIMNEIQRLVDSGQVVLSQAPYMTSTGFMPGYQQPQSVSYNQASKYCPMCGKPNPQEARFCISCGSRFP